MSLGLITRKLVGGKNGDQSIYSRQIALSDLICRGFLLIGQIILM